MTRTRTLLLCAAILLGAAVAVVLIFRTEPTAQRSGATRETAMLVDVTTVDRGTYRPTVVAMGTVRPAREIVLAPRVEGTVVERPPAFEPGSDVRRGQVLVRIDPADYRNALEQRRSELRQAEADLELEMGRQDVARQDVELVGVELAPENEALVLRRPQLATAQARVESARAAVEQAQLDLERATLRSPFDAHVLTREVDVGSQLEPGEPVARLVGTDVYWVEAAVPLAKLRFIAFPGGSGAPGAPGATVQVRDRAAWPEGTYRQGRVDKLLGELAGATRMARVLVTVPDPLGRRADGSAPAPPALMIGAFVEIRIEADELGDVVRLSRDHLRKDDTVWVMEDGKLRIRDVQVAFRDQRWVYVASGLEDGDRVVTTHLSTVVDGAPLRLKGEGEGGEDGAAAAEDAP